MTCGASSGRHRPYLKLPCPKGFRPWLKVKVFGRPVFLSKVEPINMAVPYPLQAKAVAQACSAAADVDP
jgi:hypothetical protein